MALQGRQPQRSAQLAESDAVSEPWKKTYAASDAGPWQKTYSGAKAANPQQEALADARRRVTSTPGIIRSISQGIGFNFADDLDANVAMAETAVNNALGGALFGKKSYTPQQAKAAVLQAEREASQGYARSNPVASGTGTVVGAIASPANKVLGPLAIAKPGAGMGAQMLRAGTAGSAAGGLAGAGDQGVEGILPGAAFGFGVGAAVPPVFRAVSGAAQPMVQAVANRVPENIRNAVTAGVNAMGVSAAERTGLPPPPPRANPAEVKVARALDRAIQRDVRAGVQFKPGQNPLYQGGDNLFGVYEAAAASPGAAQTAVRRAVDANRAQTAKAVAQDVQSALGAKGDFFSYQNNLITTQRDNARQGMEKLGEHLVTLDENSILALRSDRARSALQDAAENMRANTDPAIRNQAGDLMRVLDQVLDKPSGVTLRVRDAQNISEKLLKGADRAFRNGDGDTGVALKDLGRAIRDNARDPNRGGFADYDAWLKQYGLDADNKSALEMGKNVLNNSVWPEEVQQELAAMDPAAMLHYRKGVAEALFKQVKSAKGDISVMRRLTEDQNLGEKIALAFPDDASFAAFVKSAATRVKAAERNNAITAQSRTAPKTAAMKDLSDPQDPIEAGVDEAVNALSSPQSVPGRLARGLSKVIPKRTGVLNDEEANAILGQTAINPDEITRLLNVLQATRAQNAIRQSKAARAAVPLASTIRF